MMVGLKRPQGQREKIQFPRSVEFGWGDFCVRTDVLAENSRRELGQFSFAEREYFFCLFLFLFLFFDKFLGCWLAGLVYG